jgi:hypothetical protein
MGGIYMDTTKDPNAIIFNILSGIFLIIFLILSIKRGITYGFKTSFFIWAFFVCSVPIPQVALLLSFPLKHIININMAISQIAISIIAICALVYFYINELSFIRQNDIGKVFINIMKHKMYSIFILSIIGSIIGTYILDEIFDYIKKEKYNIDINLLFSNIIMFILINIVYLYVFVKDGIYMT